MIIRPYKRNDDSDLSGAKPGKGLRMNREQAEKLLAALIFDDLDETSKAELAAYLQTDDELRDRLADLRMAVKLADDAVNEGPDPVLGERRLKQLKRLAKADKARVRVFPTTRFIAVAAVLMLAFLLVGTFMPRMAGTSRMASSRLISQEASDDGVAHYMGPSQAQSRAAARSAAGRSAPPMAAPAPAAPRPATRNVPSESTVSTARSYNKDVGQVEYGMGGMGGYAGGTSVSGGGVRGGSGAAYGPDSSVTAGREVLMQTVAPEQRRVTQLRRSSPAETVMSTLPAAPMIRPSQSGEKELLMAKETNGDAAASEARLKDVLGKRLTGVETDEMKGLVSSLPGGRGSVAAEMPTKFDEKVGYAWSGKVTPEKPAVPMVTPTPSDSAVAFDKELDQRLGINGSVKNEKPVPVLGDVPIKGELFSTMSTSEKKTKSESLIEERQRDDNSSNRSLIQDSNLAPAQRGPEPTAQLDLVVAQDASGLPAQSHFKVVPVNPWVMTDRDAFSTFGLDVDTASYALCRRYIRGGFLPPVGAVRMEEFVNAFDYAYPQRDDATFAVHAEGAPSPFAPAGQDLALLKVAVKARTVGRDQRRAANLVFVVDASASMGQADRLPVVQSVSNQLVDKLSEADRVSLVTCANEARLHLEAVSARQKDAIHQTINAIQPAGPTNLLAGLKLGYDMARKSFVAGQTNQVVLCSDGVANVGQTEAEAMLKEVAEDRKQAITLTCVGVGYGAYNDAFLEALADQGDGRYVFLDSSEQAQEALVGQLAGSWQNVATDARIQVQFNPTQVRRYRLIGYENRDIEDQRFRDDTVEAGAVGSGQCSTALYELELTGPTSGESEADLGTVFVRYRNTETGQIEEISRPLAPSLVRRRSVEDDPRFFLAAGAARLAEWLRQSEHAQQTSLTDVQRLLDHVSAALPLDRQVQDLAALAHQAEGLPRRMPGRAAPLGGEGSPSGWGQAATEPPSQP